MTAAVTYFVFRAGLGAVCLWAGLEKARGLDTFAHGVAQYRMLPLRFVRPAATAIVAAELAVGVLLLTDLLPLAAAAGAIGLFALFAVALAVSLARSNRGPCHCFGASDAEMITPLALIRALVLLGLAVATFGLALTDPAFPPGDAVLPGILMATAIAITTRLSSLFPLTWSFFKAQPALHPAPTNRVSFRHQPLDVPLYPRREEEQ
jgi:uncharacterized membrane protein YphA (DoxX/SURF4 family)